MILEVDPRSPVAPYEQLRQQITALVLAGGLAPGDRLPSIRQLANDLGLAGGTVARAYRELDQDGYIVSHRGRGTFPSPARVASAEDKYHVLRSIYDKAIAEAAGHGIAAAEVVRFFHKVKS